MNAEQVRVLLFQRQIKVQPLAASLPDLAALDGLLGVRELSAKDTTDIGHLSKDRNDTIDEALALAGLVVRGLILLDTKEPIFRDTELDSVAAMGMTVLKPIAEAVNVVSGLSVSALVNAKKNLNQTTDSTSPTSSPANSQAA